MTRHLRLSLLFVGAAAAVLVPARVADACWCSRAYTRSYFSPCVTCPTVSRSYYVPVVARCPTTSCGTTCTTTNVERCYYEAQTVYTIRTVLQPTTAYVRRSYYDPVTCCYRSYLTPTTQFVERSYQLPMTTWTQRCSTEPTTSCTTNYVQSASYWSTDGHHYYPFVTAAPSSSCPAPSSNGSSPRESSYGPSTDSKKSGDSNGSIPQAPDPKPMPSKSNGARSPTPRSGDPLAVRQTISTSLPQPNSGFVYPVSRGSPRANR